MPGTDLDAVLGLQTEIGWDVVHYYGLVEGPAQHGQIFDRHPINIGEMVPVQFITDAMFRIDLTQDLIRILLQSSRKDGDLIVVANFLEELFCEGTHME